MDTNPQIPSPDHFDGLVADETSTIVTSLLSITKSTRALLGLRLADIGLCAGQDQMLDFLDRATPICVSDLAQRLAVRPSTISKMLDRLAEKGLVVRQPLQSDARRTMVHLTPEGEHAQARVRDIWNQIEIEFEQSLGEDELLSLRASLSSTEHLLSAKLHRLR